MKVVYLINQYPQLSHSFIRREIRALETLGVEVSRVSLRPASPQVEPADVAEAARTWVLQKAGPVACLAAISSILFTRPIRFFSTLKRTIGIGRRSRAGVLKHLFYLLEACILEKRVRHERATHIHAHFGTNSATVALLCRWLGGPAFSFTVHGPEEFDDVYGLALPAKLHEAAFSVAISGFGRSQLLRHSRVNEWAKVHIVRCGVDASFLEDELTPIPATLRLACVGRLSEQKGHLLLLQALKVVRERGHDFEAVLVGDGPLRDTLNSESHRLGLSGLVRFLGSQSQSRVREEILNARAFVLPSFAEGLPVVFMEALALGRPVLSTYVAGIPELVEDNVCGWLVPAGCVDRLADALERALTASVDELAAMGRTGRERVVQMHDVDREAACLARLFRSCEPTSTSDQGKFPRIYERPALVGSLANEGNAAP